MTDYWVAADKVFDGYHLHHAHAILLRDGCVAALGMIADTDPDEIRRHHKGILCPGFLDIQVNGGGGILFNNSPDLTGMKTIIEAHRKFGTVGVMPTVITDRVEVLEAAVGACLDGHRERGFLGLHIEGPHIAPSRRGTHAPEHVRKMDEGTLSLARALREAEIPVLVTIAPEAVTNHQIRALSDMGVTVSIGHSAANPEEVKAALRAGARCFTHLYNAMPPLINRDPGVAGVAITSEAWCSVIVDNVHVDPVMVQMAFNARPLPDRMILISDAMASIGGPDRFDLYGEEITLKEGRLVNSRGTLSGAHLTVCQAMQNLVAMGVSLETALRTGRHNPAKLLRLENMDTLVGCAVDDVLLLSPDLKLQSVGL